MSITLRRIIPAAALILAAAQGATAPRTGHAGLVMLVLDPLARQNACPCVKGYAQRDYGALAAHVARRVGRPVAVRFGTNPAQAARDLGRAPDILVAKQSVAEAWVGAQDGKMHRAAMLTGKDGAVTQHGVFVVRSDDAAERLEDLRGRRIVFGPAEEEEKSAAAAARLRHAGLPVPARLPTRPNCNIAALAVVDREADAAVISSYALPLLSGCGTIKAGALKVIGQTQPVPFVAVYVSTRVGADVRRAVVDSLLAVVRDPALRAKLETRSGFVLPAAPTLRGGSHRGVTVPAPPAPPRRPYRHETAWCVWPAPAPPAAGLARAHRSLPTPGAAPG